MDVKHRIMTSLHDCRNKLDGRGRKMAFKISAAVARKHTITEKWNRLFFFPHLFFFKISKGKSSSNKHPH